MVTMLQLPFVSPIIQNLNKKKSSYLMLANLFSKTQLGCLFNIMDDMYMNIQSDKLFHSIPKGISQARGSEPHQYTWIFV